jgi:hypothetical protein
VNIKVAVGLMAWLCFSPWPDAALDACPRRIEAVEEVRSMLLRRSNPIIRVDF